MAHRNPSRRPRCGRSLRLMIKRSRHIVVAAALLVAFETALTLALCKAAEVPWATALGIANFAVLLTTLVLVARRVVLHEDRDPAATSAQNAHDAIGTHPSAQNATSSVSPDAESSQGQGDADDVQLSIDLSVNSEEQAPQTDADDDVARSAPPSAAASPAEAKAKPSPGPNNAVATGDDAAQLESASARPVNRKRVFSFADFTRRLLTSEKPMEYL